MQGFVSIIVYKTIKHQMDTADLSISILNIYPLRFLSSHNLMIIPQNISNDFITFKLRCTAQSVFI